MLGVGPRDIIVLAAACRRIWMMSMSADLMVRGRTIACAGRWGV